ncbi:hypothetical protein PPYR_03031 [Photinus pyralis]|uniref:Protein zer-1 homolog-like C-terminal domain-containing protein n=2 Tax=Photinus pyralis TaxID=7054 RepID=A0A1Y1KDP8_PHOPY|nr:protein zyg-11 homolog B-like [Photinus pyralis]KAB0791231.1 hypothetical protein PPYR_03031 [Photinus pyralis]
MFDSPTTLREICLEFICDNILRVFELYYETNSVTPIRSVESEAIVQKKLRFKDSDLFLFNEISESLLSKFGERHLLSDSTLSLFAEKNTRLRTVKIKNAKKLTYEGLKILRQHKIVHLECVGLKSVCVNKILDCLGEWSRQNITSLNISECSFIDSSRHCLMIALTHLKNLHSLNVSYTEFNQQTLKLICDDLKLLEKLDISGTSVYDLTPLLQYADTLVSLTLADFKLSKALASTVVKLGGLRHLDVSVSSDKLDMSDCSGIQEVLEHEEALPNLVSLELSGWRDFASKETLDAFLRKHAKLRYLGLVLNWIVVDPQYCDPEHVDFNPNLVIAGVGSESQIKVTLQKHYERANYVQKALYHLFQLTSTFQEARPDVFALVLPAMEAHPTKFGVQMAATACVYNLTRGELSKRIHPKLLSRGVNLTLNAMMQFPDEYQLQKNALLTLCSDRILQEVSFDRFRCAKLVLDSLCAFEGSNMNRMAVAICSILAAKVSTDETSELGARPNYMRKLLSMVQSRMETKVSDITMKFTLSALWNLTDESAATCTVFLEQGGATLFLNVLKTFRFDSAIETKVLGLLNNIAEVEKLRMSLMLNSLIEELYSLLKSDLIDVSYFAAGIVAHLASDGPLYWSVNKFTRDEMLVELRNAVSQWKVPDSEMVAYRSFKPFFPLMRPEMDYPIQLWAVWAIHHVCTKNPSRYCLMLREEKGVEYLLDLLADAKTHEDIRSLVGQILQLLKVHF